MNTQPRTREIADNGESLVASSGGFIEGVAWGPAADGSGEWFVRRADSDAFRVADKDSALTFLRSLPATRGICREPRCGRDISLTKKGVLRVHGREKDLGNRWQNCPGSGKAPVGRSTQDGAGT